MREAVALFGLTCGLIVIWTVGNYGYSSADDPAAKWNMAFLFGVIAAGGLFGHAVAQRAWCYNKLLSLAVYLVCGVALIVNLSNSLGALATRNSRSESETSSKASTIKDDRAELARLQKALDKLGSYVATDQAAVDAAKRALDAASTAMERECGNGDPKQRGRFCRDKEDAEKTAADVLTKATAAKAVTDRAMRIETDMRPIHERLRLAGSRPGGQHTGQCAGQALPPARRRGRLGRHPAAVRSRRHRRAVDRAQHGVRRGDGARRAPQDRTGVGSGRAGAAARAGRRAYGRRAG